MEVEKLTAPRSTKLWNSSNSFIISLLHAFRDKNRPIYFDDFLEIVGSRVGDTKTKEDLRVSSLSMTTMRMDLLSMRISKQWQDGSRMVSMMMTLSICSTLLMLFRRLHTTRVLHLKNSTKLYQNLPSDDGLQTYLKIL